MADPFCLVLIEAGPGRGDRAQVTVWPWAVLSTWLFLLEKLPMGSCKAVVLQGSCWSLALHPSPCLAHSKKAA